jgi:PAS domain S-box-containing protein
MKLSALRPAAFWQSLQTRMTVLTFAVLLTGLWSLAWYVSNRAHDDLERLLSEQQRSDVITHAEEINRAVSDRMNVLQSFAIVAAPVMAQASSEVQPLLKERPALVNFFNAGFFVTDAQGTAIASVPEGVQRIGVNYMERDHVASALKDGKPKVSKPVVGKVLQVPVVSQSMPIRNAQGQIIGAVVGVTDLTRPNFLEKLMSDVHSARGSMTLIARPWKLAVFASEKGQLLKNLSEMGLGSGLERFLDSPAGTTKLIDASGTEVLVSSAHIAAADWTLVAILPTSQAFATADQLARDMWSATAGVTLLCTFMVGWLMRRQLAPVRAAHSALVRQRKALQTFEPLPRIHNDEIGQLIDGFNALISEVSARELAQRDSDRKLHATARRLQKAQRIAGIGSWSLDLGTNALQWSEEIFRILEIDSKRFQADYLAFQNTIHPDDRDNANAAYSRSVQDHKPYQIEHRLRMADGRIKWIQERCHTEFDAHGTPLRSMGTVQDVTERKLADDALAQSRDLLLTIIESIPMRVFWKDRNLTFMGCNTLLARDAGMHGPADLIGKDDYAMGWAPQADLYRADDLAVIESGQAKLFYDEPQTTPDGDTVWLRTSKIPLKDPQGSVIGVLGLYEDISERKRAELELRKLSLIAEQSPETILITDLQGRIEYVNASFTHETGYTREEAVGQNPRLLQSGKNSPATYADMWDALAAGNTWSGELINRRKDGTLYIDWAVITPLRAPDGSITHYVSIQEDITERKQNADELERHRHGLEALVAQRTEELNSARQLADAANRSKSEFLANMSHEIRTPMNGVIGMVDVLRKTPLNPEQARMLDTVQKSSLALMAILNDILDFSKIEAGKLDIEQTPMQLQDVLDNVMRLMKNNASARNVALTWTIAPDLPDWMQSDPTRIRQILLNLVGNAVKFAPPNVGKVQVQARAVTRADASPGVQIVIADNGIGMKTEVIARLFHPFTQADASTMRKYGGTGLGLSITQRLVQMMQGHITVQSQPGTGSEFTVELPLIEADPFGPASGAVPLSPQEPSYMSATPMPPSAIEDRVILLAEDNETNRDVVHEQLRQLGYAVEMAVDGVEAIALWRSGRHALLLTDCHMPRMDGFELTESIRKAEPPGTRLPIIAITANAMQGVAQRCKDYGMDDYLSKPLRMEELARMLAKWMPSAQAPLARGVTGAAHHATNPARATEPCLVWDPLALGLLVGENADLQKQLLAKFLRNAQNQMQALDTARADGNLSGITSLAHTLKSAARTVGAMALGELCEAVEAAGRAGDLQSCLEHSQAMPDALAQAEQQINRFLSA